MTTPLPLPAEQPTLETERLILRPYALSDASELSRAINDFAVADTTLNIPHPYPDGAAADYISSRLPAYTTGKEISFVLTLSDTGRLIGAMGLVATPRFNHAEIGYWIARAEWNQGYATEAAQAVVRFGFETWGLHKIVGTHLRRNPASGRVMEKVGLQFEGVLRDHTIKWDRYEDLVIRGLVRT